MRHVLGIAAFVATFGAAGFGLLLPLVRVRRSDVLQLLPVAYMVGLAGLGATLTVLVIVGMPLRLSTVVGTAAVFLCGGFVAGQRREQQLPIPTARSPSLFDLTVASAALAATLVVLEAMFRAARLSGLYGWDAGAFWVPKAEAVYFTGGLDERHFETIPGVSYPPLVPVVQAAAFLFQGGADPASLHLVYWTVAAALALGSGVVLMRYTAPAIAWISVLLLVGASEVVARALVPQGDFLMDAFLAFLLILLVLFVRERRWEPAALAIPFAAAAALTKREALLVLAAMAIATAISTVRRRRAAWPWAAAVLVTAFVVLLPWRLWTAAHELPGPGPEEGPLVVLDHLDRLWPSIQLVASTLGDPEHWSVILVVAVLAIVASLAARRTEGVLVAAFLVLSAAAFVWVMWALPSVPLTQAGAVNPIVRFCGAALIPCALSAPLLVWPILEPVANRFTAASARARRFAVTSVVAAALVYPGVVLIVDGAPRFPSPEDCSDRLAVPTPPFEVIYFRSSSFARARAEQERAVGAGFVDAQVRFDGCGHWKVVNLDVDTAEQLRGHLADARRVGYDPWLERA